MTNLRTPILTLLFCIVLIACSDDDGIRKTATPTKPTQPVSMIKPDMTEQQVAETLWIKRCITCHGPHGKGDGLVAASIPDKPADFNSAKWQDAIDDARIRKAILEGGESVGKSKSMKPSPELKGHDEALDILVAKVRAYRPKKTAADAGVAKSGKEDGGAADAP